LACASSFKPLPSHYKNHRTKITAPVLSALSILPLNSAYFASMSKRRGVHLIDLNDRLTVTIDRTAQLLEVGRSTVYELLRAGKLKGVKFGRAHRVVVQSIRDLVEEA
jgi:excisionase family DNA binding protein